MIDSPSEQDIRHAMTRALEVRLRTYRDQPFTEAALRERVTALPGRVEHRGDDWWCVGQIIDSIAGVELEVHCRPPRLRLAEVPNRFIEPGPPTFIAEDAIPMTPPRYFKRGPA